MAFTSKIIAALMLAAAFLALPAQAIQTDMPKINVLADPSLSVAISKLARQFANQQGISVTVAYAPSQQQAADITVGLEADVFITPDISALEDLQIQGLLDVYSKKEVAKNRITLNTYAENPLKLILVPKLSLASILRFTDPEFSFAIGDPQFQSSGSYALKALRTLEMAGDLEPNMLFVRSRADMLRTIGQKGGYGILYQSDAYQREGIKTLATLPEATHDPILYYGMVVAGEQMEESRRFVEFLTSPQSQELFKSLGFDSLTTYKDESGHLARGSAVRGSVSPL